MDTPLVSIGIPAYNEAEYLRTALENLLEQTYSNTEIIISDNASTDTTGDIAAEYAQKHPTIRHVRHGTNLGQHGNFNCLPTLAKGEFFLWAAGHDLLEKDFIEVCVRELQTHKNAVLAFPRTIDILPDGKPFNENRRLFHIETLPPWKRFKETMWRVDCNYVYGVFRREQMLTTRLFQKIPAPDRVFLAEMAARGPFVSASTFRYCRMNRGAKQTELEKRRRLMKYIDPEASPRDTVLMKNSFYTPTMRAFKVAITEAHLSSFDRLKLRLSAWICGVMKFHLFPGADTVSALVKTVLPKSVLKKIVSKMQ